MNYFCNVVPRKTYRRWEGTSKSSAFSVKSVTNLFSWNNGGIRGVFLLFKKMFKRDQYVFEFQFACSSWVIILFSFIYLLRGIVVLREGSVYSVIDY